MRSLSRRLRAAGRCESAQASTEFRPARDVLCTRMDDRAVLLDLRREQYFGLDEVGSAIWEGLERGERPSELAVALARQYDAPVEAIAADMQRFIAELQRRGLVDERVTAPRRPLLRGRRAASHWSTRPLLSPRRAASRPPRLAACFALLALMDVCPRLIGLRRTLRLLQSLAAVSATCGDTALVAETTRRLITAAAFYPRRALCLEQSLALVLLLRRRGIAAELRIGVQPLPFFAHAWVEVEGRAIEETQGRPMQLATFSALGV